MARADWEAVLVKDGRKGKLYYTGSGQEQGQKGAGKGFVTQIKEKNRSRRWVLAMRARARSRG